MIRPGLIEPAHHRRQVGHSTKDGMPAMNHDHQILQLIERAFGALERPRHFTHVWHCDECAAHDERLQLCDRQTITLEDVAYVAYDPFCVATPHALGYFFPALAKFALGPPNPEHGWYASQLLFHLHIEEIDNPFYRFCDDHQRQAVTRLLAHIVETRAGLALAEGSIERFMRCHQLWSAPLVEGRMLN